MSRAKDLLTRITEQDFFEMANVPPFRSGLSVNVFVSEDPGRRKSPRVKVSNTTRPAKAGAPGFTLSIAENPEVLVGQPKISPQELKKVKQWVSQNRETLLKLWNGEIDQQQALNDFQSVGL